MSAVAEPAIRCERVNKWYGAEHALRDVDLQVAAGERVVICGPSGSGKSTLIRCLNGLEAQQQGRIVVAGIELGGDARARQRAVARVRREVGIVFQQFNLFPHLSVLDNLTLAPMWTRGLPRAQAERLALAQLDRVRVAGQAHKFPLQLSGGQQQRVAIARALCQQPRILLFDEPTSALDPESIQEVLDVMVELARAGTTMVCATHEMGFARAVADRMVFMDQGQVVEQGSPAALFDAPRQPRTREFLSRVLQR